MNVKFMSKKERLSVRNTKSLNSFFKTQDGKPFCFGKLGEYQNENKCSDCKYKRECFKIYDKN